MSNNHDDYDVPSIVPERDELVSHRSRKRGNSIPVAAENVTVRASGTVRFLLFVLFAGMLATGAGAYFFYMQGTTALGELSSAESRIADLESRLSAVGENSEETTLGLIQRIELNFSEIDKLWAARNENRTNITTVKTVTESQGEVLGSLEAAVTSHGSMLNENAALLGNVQSRLQTITNNISNIESLNQQLTAINTDLGQVKSSLASLGSEVPSRLETMEQDIESINIYRLQLNQTISAMQADISQLQELLGR